jgi:hypothetical protein
MNINRKSHLITRILASIVLMLVFFPYPKLFAQQLDCDPLPEDPDLVMQCNMQDLNNSTYSGELNNPQDEFDEDASSTTTAGSPNTAPQARNSNANTDESTRINKLPTLINQIYVWSLGVGALLALLMCVLGGYYYMTSAGNAEQSSKGKEYITSALIGLVIIFTAYLLLREINPDLVNFNVNSLKYR